MNLMASAQKRYVLEQAVDTLAAIAEIAGKKFAKVGAPLGQAGRQPPPWWQCCG